ncbi:MAG: hypothetical protein NTY23_11275 [Chloroflexi bacterium]|nr:hypothetical protein [Chloroflexota bacterium]
MERKRTNVLGEHRSCKIRPDGIGFSQAEVHREDGPDPGIELKQNGRSASVPNLAGAGFEQKPLFDKFVRHSPDCRRAETQEPCDLGAGGTAVFTHDPNDQCRDTVLSRWVGQSVRKQACSSQGLCQLE